MVTYKTHAGKIPRILNHSPPCSRSCLLRKIGSSVENKSVQTLVSFLTYSVIPTSGSVGHKIWCHVRPMIVTEHQTYWLLLWSSIVQSIPSTAAIFRSTVYPHLNTNHPNSSTRCLWQLLAETLNSEARINLARNVSYF
jgi:hypothetical protein